MCGIAGFFDPMGFNSAEAEQLARLMGSMVVHRGPDDSGVWVDGKSGIALAHQRLSVLDLSPAGHQPMISPSHRYVIVYNGEIYYGEHLIVCILHSCITNMFFLKIIFHNMRLTLPTSEVTSYIR